MSLQTKQIAFGEFVFRLDERVLLFNKKPVQVTPKALALLQLLLENHGRVVEKQKMLDSVWGGSYVEEGNISFTVRQLRKILNDDAQNPIFIETIPKRGYRFIAAINEGPQPEPNEPFKTRKASSFSKTRLVSVSGSLLLIGGVIGFIYWYAKQTAQTVVPVLEKPASIETLTTDGLATHPVISPDGKRVYFAKNAGGKESLWVREIGTSNSLELAPASDEAYFGTDISPDGETLFFVRGRQGRSSPTVLYRMPSMGGIPKKLADSAQGWTSLSPDGKIISFVRCEYAPDDYCSLWIANADNGEDQLKLVTKPSPLRITDSAFSTDGKAIYFATGQSDSASNEFELQRVEIDSGAVTLATPERFFVIGQVSRVGNGGDLLLIASRTPDRILSFWHLGPNGKPAVKLGPSNDVFSTISFDNLFANLISTRVREDFALRIYDFDRQGVGKLLGNSKSVDFASDGRLVFVSRMSGNSDVWIMDQDGSGLRQITNDENEEFSAIAAPDRSGVFYGSNASGQLQLWFVKMDGTMPLQITQNVGGYPLAVSADGNSIYYLSGSKKHIWMANLDGTGERPVIETAYERVAISTNGKFLATVIEKTGAKSIVVTALERKTGLLKEFPIAGNGSKVVGLAWFRDNASVAYVVSDIDNHRNELWVQNLRGGAPTKITDLSADQQLAQSGFAISPDGRSFAVVAGGWKSDVVLLKGLR